MNVAHQHCKPGPPGTGRVTIVTNAPAPYRSPVFAELGREYEIIFCASAESNRNWGPVDLNFKHRFIPGRVHRHADGFNYTYFNWSILRVLREIDPLVVVTTGFNPTHLLAFAWAKLHSRPHVAMTDSTLISEAKFSLLHRVLRRIVYRRTSAFIVASRGGSDLLQSYDVDPSRIVISRLCAPTPVGEPPAMAEREFDVMFCGQLHPRKAPLFFVEVCRAIRDARGACRSLIVGDGPLREDVIEALDHAAIDYSYLSAVDHNAMGALFTKAKVLLFPTLQDAWGLVANEAFAAGTPVITSPEAGVAGDLVIDGENGYIAPMVVGDWRDLALNLLSAPKKWASFSEAARTQSRAFSFTEAAAGIKTAIQLTART